MSSHALSMSSVPFTSKAPKPDHYVIHGQTPGPVVMITAGIHGTEVAGVILAHSLRDLSIKRGTLVVVPLVNLPAYRKHVRGRPDVNRSFPRHRKDNARGTPARHVFDLAKKYQPDWCFDLHEANGLYRLNRRKLGQTIIVYPNRATKYVAGRVVDRVNDYISKPKLKFSVRSGELAGSFRTAAGKVLGARALTVETCIQLKRKTRVAYQRMIVRELLREVGML